MLLLGVRGCRFLFKKAFESAGVKRPPTEVSAPVRSPLHSHLQTVNGRTFNSFSASVGVKYGLFLHESL